MPSVYQNEYEIDDKRLTMHSVSNIRLAYCGSVRSSGQGGRSVRAKLDIHIGRLLRDKRCALSWRDTRERLKRSPGGRYNKN